MYTEENCPNIHCSCCKYYKSNAELENVKSECKRVDHKKIRFYKPWFATYDCGSKHIPCNDFVPKHPEYEDFKEWTNFDDFWKVYCKTWLPKKEENSSVAFFINGDESTMFSVKLKDFIDGSFIKDGILNAYEKAYYKQTKSGFGYKLVKEKIKGVKIL